MNMKRYFEEKEENYSKLQKLIRMGLSLSKEIINKPNKRKLNKLLKLTKNAKSLCKAFNMEQRFFELEKETSEALIIFYIEKNTPKSITEILNYLQSHNISYEAMLISIAESIGEMKRKILSMLIEQRYKEAERLGKIAMIFYEYIETFVISNAVLPGFRRMQDVAKMNLESIKELLVNCKRLK